MKKIAIHFYLVTLLACSSLVLSACDQPIPAADSGIRGYVSYGPIGDIVWGIDSLDYAPLPAVPIQILDNNGNVLAKTSTDATGHYSIKITAGDYQIEGLALAGPRPRAWPPTGGNRTKVIVRAGRMSVVDFKYFTYIRM